MATTRRPPPKKAAPAPAKGAAKVAKTTARKAAAAPAAAPRKAAASPPAEPEASKINCPRCGGPLRLIATATSEVTGPINKPDFRPQSTNYELKCPKGDFSLKRSDFAALLEEFIKRAAA